MPPPRTPIPIFRPDISEEVVEAVAEALRSRWLGPGPRKAAFETAFAAFTGAAHAISTSTGTAALKAVLAVLGVGPGDEIILPSFNWISLFHVLRELGATPVFADIEPRYLTIDPEDVRRRITSRTKAVVAVHHGGQLCDLAALQGLASEAEIFLVEDAAHACGARYGPFPIGAAGSTAACFSFNAMKNLAIGDGGMVTTQDSDLAVKIERYRSLGIDMDTYSRYGAADSAATHKRWEYNIVSHGERIHMNDIAAAAGLVQLRRLPEGNRRRTALASAYQQGLRDVPSLRLIEPRPDTTPSWHMLTVLMRNRDLFVEKMLGCGVRIGVHYHPLHLFPICREYATSLPVTEELWQQVTTFPMYTELSVEDQDYVIQSARAVAGEL